ncbi:hypothetical protein CFP56_034012 [Quercus suber]|uniref:Uncharacterized protein n=1 Tax=Quercus suber TaxID=58331 RepID=A0AAW0JDC7_QUESU
MDELSGQWACLSLNPQESQTVPLDRTIEDNSKVLIAKLFTKLQHSVHEFEIYNLSSNTIPLLFSNEANALKIMA